MIEVTAVLTAMTILSSAAAPAIGDYVEDAKLVRAATDTRTLGVSLAPVQRCGFSARRGAWVG